MSNITKPMMLDETGKQIVNAILSTDVTQARIAEINEAASAKQTEAISAIEAKGEEQLAKIPEVTELAGQVSSLSEEIHWIYSEKNQTKLWSLSSINPSTGTIVTSTNRMLLDVADTPDYVRINEGYKYSIIAKKADGEYVGLWDGTSYVKTVAWLTDTTKFALIGDYKFAILAAKIDDTDINLVEDAPNIIFGYTYDHSLSGDVVKIIDSYPPAAYEHSEEPYTVTWSQGRMSAEGVVVASNYYIYSNYIPIGSNIQGAFTPETVQNVYWVRIFDASKTLIATGVTIENGTVVESSGYGANPIDVDTVANIFSQAAFVVLTVATTDRAEITTEQSGMTFTCTKRGEFIGGELNKYYARKVKAPYTSKEIVFMYDIGNGYKTKGFLKLPPNYTQAGDKVPLVVFVHGSADVGGITINTMTTNYQEYYNYIRDSGYAVFDCYPFSDKYASLGSHANTFGIPLNNNCYLSGIRFVCEKYNIDIGNVFVSCKSLGGLQAFSMLMNPDMPVKAVGMLAPELWQLNMRFGYEAAERKAIAAELGFSEDVDGVLEFGQSDTIPEGFYDYVTANMDKWCGIFANFIGLQMPPADRPNYYRLATGTETMFRNSLGRPLKIWIAEDDSAVYYGNSLAVVKSLQNAGYHAELRTMPNDTGGHHSVDNDPNAPQTANVVTKLGITYTTIPTAYYELVQFFDRFLSK